MPRVFVVEISSLGDVARPIPAMVLGCVVEQSFSKEPGRHPSVGEAEPMPTRRCTKYSSHAWLSGEWTQFKEQVCYFNTSFTGVVK